MIGVGIGHHIIVPPYFPPAVALVDDFNRVDNVSLGATPIGNAVWREELGDLRIIGNVMSRPAGNVNSVAVVPLNSAKGTIKCKFRFADGAVCGGTLLFRYVDVNNQWLCRLTRSVLDAVPAFEVRRMVNGGTTAQIITNPPIVNGTWYELQIRILANGSIEAYLDNVLQGAPFTNTLFEGAALAGIRLSGSSTTITADDFSYTP